MIPGKKYTPEDMVAIAWRRRWLAAIPLLVAAAGSALVVQALPSRWVSTAVISIVPQTVPESYVRSTVTIGPQDRVESIRRRILSQPRLEQVIRELDLYPDLRRSQPMADIVKRMREEDVEMEPAKDEAFEVRFYAGDPRLAQRVAARLTGLFIDENIRERTKLAEGSSEFLDRQLEQVKARLETTEGRLEAYRRGHAGELPDQVEANMQAVANAQMQLQQLRESINRDKDRRLLIERQVADVNDLPIIDVSRGNPSEKDDDEPVMGGSAADRLLYASAELASLERRLKPEHPDVIRTRRLVSDLEEEARLEAQLPATASEAKLPRTPVDLAQRKRLRDLETELAVVDRNIAGKQEEEGKLLAIAGEYQRRLDAAPARESDLKALMRDYETVSEQYKRLLTNSQSAQMAEDLERRRGGEQFSLVEEAQIPHHPVSPKRPIIVALGAMAGLGLGVALILLLEFRDRSVRTRADVLAALSLPVLAVVPVMTTHEERRVQRMRGWAASGAGTLLFLATIAAVWSALTP